jgi:hypothetical protein
MPVTKLPSLGTQDKDPVLRYIPMNYDLGGYMMLPEYGFGSWLKSAAGGLFKGASSLAGLIPGIGSIAGPVLDLAGSVLTAGQQRKADKALAEQQQKEINAKIEADKKLQLQQQLLARTSNLFGGDQDINYGATFAYGGDLLMNPQIVNYSNKADKHSEGIGGIPVDIKGNPTKTSKMSAVGMTEGGELAWDGYIFSNKLKVK